MSDQQPTALLLHHMAQPLADRLCVDLRRRGYRLLVVCPVHGDALPRHYGGLDLCVVYGGPQSANDPHPYLARELRWLEGWLATGRPLLGLCLGAQLLARVLGAPVARHAEGRHEIGYVQVRPTVAGRALLAAPLEVYQWHCEGFELPRGAELLAAGEIFVNQAFRYGERAYGLQFHPEVTPPIMCRWMDEVRHMLDEPGAHPRARQLADAERFDGPMGAWLHRFVGEHLLGRQGLSSKAGSSTTLATT